MRSSPLDWSALCTTNPSAIEMATIVDPKTWEKLDFTLEMATRLGEVVYCGLLSNFTFSQSVRNCFDFSLQQTRM
jgi:hypothetical protein